MPKLHDLPSSNKCDGRVQVVKAIAFHLAVIFLKFGYKMAKAFRKRLPKLWSRRIVCRH